MFSAQGRVGRVGLVKDLPQVSRLGTQGPASLLYKWKNHFFEMKGDVGMSSHEKEREQEDAFTQTQTQS